MVYNVHVSSHLADSCGGSFPRQPGRVISGVASLQSSESILMGKLSSTVNYVSSQAQGGKYIGVWI